MRTLGVPAALAVLALPGLAAAGKRVAAVAPSCASELASLERDVEGEQDRCVATATPGCRAGERLAVDAHQQADRCLPEGPAVAAELARVPSCVAGLSLEERTERDVCRRVDKPRCPSGLKLQSLKGDDLCRK